MMSLLTLLIIAIFVIYASLQIMYAVRRFRMHKKEEALIESGNGPYGSGLCHGMVIDPEGKGVIRDSKKSPAWYSRLV